MTNERDDSMETTRAKCDPESSAVQVDDDADTDSGNSPPLAGDRSSRHHKPSNTEVATTKTGTAADLSHEAQEPTADPQTSEEEEALRELSHEDPELAEEARRLIAGFSDLDRARESGETDIARLEAKRYPNRKTSEPVITAKWDDDTLRVEPVTSQNARMILSAQATDPSNGHYLARQGRTAQTPHAFVLWHRLVEELPEAWCWWPIGIVTFAQPWWSVCRGVAGPEYEKKVLECTRLWVEPFFSEDPWAADDPKPNRIPGLASKFLRRAIEQLPHSYLFVVTYADPSVGHTGKYTYGEAGFYEARPSNCKVNVPVPKGWTGHPGTPSRRAVEKRKRAGTYQKGMSRTLMVAEDAGGEDNIELRPREPKHRWLCVRRPELKGRVRPDWRPLNEKGHEEDAAGIMPSKECPPGKRRVWSNKELFQAIVRKPLEPVHREAAEEKRPTGGGKLSFGWKRTRRARKRARRRFRDFWRTVRYVAQRQQENQGRPLNPDATAAADEPVAEQPVDASNKLPAAMEPLAGAGNGNGTHVPQPPVKLGTHKGTPRIDAPPYGGINGARRQTIGAHPREGINENRPEPKSVRLSSVQSEEVRWLWTGRIPLGKIVLLDGDPDVGKTFITHDLAARVTTGAGMPLEDSPADPAGVVILSAEDGLADTIRPRIDAAGGDLDRVECFALGTLPFIPDDLTAIEEAVTRVQARLIVVDPLIAFLKVSATNDQRVRQAMTPLADLAQRLGVAVIGIRHLTKNDRQKLAKYRGSGSIGLLGAARAAFLAAPHPTDPTCYVLARSKGNLCAPPPAVTYKIDPSLRVEWLEEVEITADQLLARPTEAPTPRLDEAIDFLRDAVKDGPRDATDVTSEAFAKGITAKTLRDAREALVVVVKRVGFGPSSKFVWSLPPTESTSNDAEG